MNRPVATSLLCRYEFYMYRRAAPAISRVIQKRRNHHVVHDQRPFRMAVIGSGPAGFYSAYKVMSRIKNSVVDMYEQLPVPFGLVRFGVAPDHPEVKNCQDKFSEVASSSRFNFVGNIDIGKDLPLSSLKPHYDAILFAHGASKDRLLGIPGEENLKGIYSARAFVGWYNGLPEYANLAPDLTTGEEAIVIGQGNVALDVARTLLSDVDRLRSTDITSPALETLSKSRVKRVRVIGRRGPFQASFTIKEVRELLHLPNVSFPPLTPSLLHGDYSKLLRRQRRLAELLAKASSNPSPSSHNKSWSLDFFLSPLSFNPSPTTPDRISSLTFVKTTLGLHLDLAAKILETSESTTLPTSLAFRSIGYKSQALPGMSGFGIPFDDKLGIIPNDTRGRVITLSSRPGDDPAPAHIPGIYCAGWVKNGPTGVIATTMEDAFATAEAVAEDWENKVPFLGQEDGREKRGWEALGAEAKTRGLRRVSWTDWRRIDEVERERGRARGKEREKLASVEEMLRVLE